MVAQIERIRRDCINLRRMIEERRRDQKMKVEGELVPARNILRNAEQLVKEVRKNPDATPNDLDVALQRVVTAKGVVRRIEADILKLKVQVEDLERHFNVSSCRRVIE